MSSGIQHCVVGRVVPNILKEHRAVDHCAHDDEGNVFPQNIRDQVPNSSAVSRKT